MTNKKKILFFASRIPYPLEKGDKLRAYYQIKYLSKNCDIVLCCMSEEVLTEKAKEELSKYVSNIHVYKTSKISIALNMLIAGFMGYPFQVGYFFNTGAHFFFNKIIKEEKPDHIFVQLIRMAEYVTKSRTIPKSLDYMDTFSKGIERRMEKASGIKKLIFKFEFIRLKRYEKRVFGWFDNTYIISEQDKASFYFEESNQIKVSPNGVDHNFFQPKRKNEKKYDLVFTGNMSYPPNVNAVEYIAKELMPLLIERKPDIKLLIAGATPVNSVKALSNENIYVSGWLDDIRDAYNDASVFIAPLQIGTGLQNKLLEAMCMEVPCITSELANNALKAKDKEEILIGNTPKEYVNAVFELLENQELNRKIIKNGKTFVTKTYNWNSITKNLEKDFFNN
ncbi:MAG: glycosyltransferase [Flavobacteriales bacterium]